VLFAGLDVGQSGTTAAIGDGTVTLALGHAGPGDEVDQGAASTRLRDAMRDALGDALARAGIDPKTRFTSIVAGISGYEGSITGAAPELPGDRVTLMHDAPIAHAAAFGHGPGVLVIAGTGSVAFARARDGRTQTTGGWGYLFGDEGSAFWIARTALVSAIECDKGCGSRIAAFFEQEGLREVTRAFYAGTMSRDRFARLASVAFDADAIHCVQRAAKRGCVELALLARRALLDPPEFSAIAVTGGLVRSASFFASLRDELAQLLPASELRPVPREPAEGALFLAAGR
jgi:glucosamine kinase